MWEERITRVTHPSILLEHVARYRVAMPIVRRSAVWADLGCGGGIAPASALDEPFHGCAMVVDNDPAALDGSRDEVAPKVDEVVPIVADLTAEEDLARIAGELSTRGRERPGCITCFEVVEHLENFVPLLDLLKEVTTRLGFTSILSVPNDAFWSIENPHHNAVWGEGAFEEFTRLLPEPRVVAHQFTLSGTSVVTTGETAPAHVDIRVPLTVDGVPSHYIIAFGPQAALIESRADVTQVELGRQRSWERQREAHLSFLQQRELDLMWLLSQCQAELAKAQEGRSRTDGKARLRRNAQVS